MDDRGSPQRSSHHHRRSHRRRRSTSSSDPGAARRSRKQDSRSPRRRRYRSRSRSPDSRYRRPSPSHSRSRSRSRDRRDRRERRHQRSRSRSRSPQSRKARQPLPPQEDSYRSQAPARPLNAAEAPPPKEKPNFRASGLLAAATNKVTVGDGPKSQDIVLKYHEPPEARKPPPNQPWAMYVFKGESKDPLETIQLHPRSCWLVGRELAVVDLPIEHPTCSKQHAVFQFRHTTKTNEYGEKKSKVGLYVLDLESSYGTFLNDDKITPARYVECRSGDVVKFAESSREYVLLLPPKK